LQGGFPKGHVVLVAGDSGTGKTMLSMEWLFKGYSRYEESGLYLTLTESVTEASKNLENLAFFSEELMADSKVRFADLRSTVKLLGLEERSIEKENIGDIVDAIEELIDETGAERVVIDSITALAYLLESKDMI
ncbi:MAG: ATPase domain-containing protein, partial [Candidatus Nanohaloarchaea archaeon]|nr:ATPase domain-containing protein [Candidatus Nanohaloarchaea archaeon]